MSAVASGENRVRGRPGLRLRCPSCALGSPAIGLGEVGVCVWSANNSDEGF